MHVQHSVRINVAQPNGVTQPIMRSSIKRIPQRLIRLLFGEFSEVLVLTPGQSVQSVEIHEMKGADDNHGKNERAVAGA